VDLIVVAHKHHAPPLQNLLEVFKRSLHSYAVGISRLLKLAQLQGTVGAACTSWNACGI
jgi:hypothetical protein